VSIAVPVPVRERRLHRMRKLTEVSRALTYAVTLDEVFRLTVTHAADLLGAEQSLLLITSELGRLSVRASHGVDPALTDRFGEPLSELLVANLATLLDAPAENFLGVPLFVDGAIKGILLVIRTHPSTTGELDEWLLSALADQAAAALEKTRLDEIGAFREQLIGIVGHDLRTPLGTIQMGAHVLLQSEGLGPKSTEVARRIARSAAVATRLIEQLLDLTRSRLGGGIPIDPRRSDMAEIWRNIIGETELRHPDRPLHVELSTDLTGVWDRDRIYQLLSNLVGNAIQHGSPRTPIGVRAEGRETEVVVEVSNKGEPIPPAAMPFIFEAFRRGRDGDATRAQQLGNGLGLGLFIAQQIARSHGGLITVAATDRDGTTFRVRLPRDSTSRSPVREAAPVS